MVFRTLNLFYGPFLYTLLTVYFPFLAHASDARRDVILSACQAPLDNRFAIVWQRATDYEANVLAHETNIQLEILTRHMGVPGTKIRLIEDGSEESNALFRQELKKLMPSLTSQARPELFLSVFSHGSSQAVSSTRSSQNKMSYHDLSKLIADAILTIPELAERLKIHICFHGCHSFSFFEYLQNMPSETFFAATASRATEAKPKISIRELENLARWLSESLERPIGVDDIALLQNLVFESPRGGLVNSHRTRFSLDEIIQLTKHVPDINEHGFTFAGKMSQLLSEKEFEIWFRTAIQDKDPRVNTIALISVDPKSRFDEWRTVFLKINPNFQTFVLRRLRSEYFFLPRDFIADLRARAEGLLLEELSNSHWKPRQ